MQLLTGSAMSCCSPVTQMNRIKTLKKYDKCLDAEWWKALTRMDQYSAYYQKFTKLLTQINTMQDGRFCSMKTVQVKTNGGRWIAYQYSKPCTKHGVRRQSSISKRETECSPWTLSNLRKRSALHQLCWSRRKKVSNPVFVYKSWLQWRFGVCTRYPAWMTVSTWFMKNLYFHWLKWIVSIGYSRTP